MGWNRSTLPSLFPWQSVDREFKGVDFTKNIFSRKNFLYLITFYILSLFVDQLCNKLAQSCYLIKALLYTGERMSVAADVWVVL